MEYLICNLESKIFPYYNMPHTTKSFIQFYLKKRTRMTTPIKAKLKNSNLVTKNSYRVLTSKQNKCLPVKTFLRVQGF